MKYIYNIDIVSEKKFWASKFIGNVHKDKESSLSF